MLRIIDDKKEIEEANRKFIEKLERFLDERITVRIGHLGANYEKKVSWSRKLDMWMLFETIAGSRYWNAFGVGRPKEGTMIPINCEINFPLNGIDRRIAGAFARDDLDNIIIVHRGKIGGGRKGIGKSFFFKHYRNELTTVQDGELQSEVALIGGLDSPRITRQVSLFVHEVDRIKNTEWFLSPKTEKSQERYEYTKEYTGTKRYKVETDIETACDHGLIVNDLAETLEKMGTKVGNDRRRDLYLVGPQNKITALFEIKTDTSTTSLYSGVGQLLLNSVSSIKRPKLILVVPNKISRTFNIGLNKVGIELLTFRWSGDKAVFPSLNSLSL